MARILIIDDSPTDVHVYRTALEQDGHEVEAAENAEEGMDKAKSWHPDLILMDVIMPGMNGFQATRSLSRDPATADIPVIIISTKNMETDKVWGLRQGAKDYITKPIEQDQLRQKIQRALGERG